MTSYLKAGDSGTLGREWSVLNGRRDAVARMYGMTEYSEGGKLDFNTALTVLGTDSDAVLDHIAEANLLPDKIFGGDLLDWSASAWSCNSRDDRIFQSSSSNLFTNIDFEKGTYQILDEQTMTEALGMNWSGGKPYDILEITNNKINFYEFIFGGTGDGKQLNVTMHLNELESARWGINNFVLREVNTELASSENEATDYESMLAQSSLKIIKDNMPQWMTKEIMEALKGLDPESSEYKKKFIDLAFKRLDQEGYLEGKEIESAGQEYAKTL